MTEALNRSIPSHQPGFRSVVVFAICALLGASLTLLGWRAGYRPLTDWAGSGISMFPNTAAAAVFAATALLLTFSARHWVARVRDLLGLVVVLIGGTTLFEHVSGIDLGIDMLFGNVPWGSRAATAPGRMGPPASLSFALVGLAIILSRRGRSRRVVPALGICVSAIATLSLIGYLFGADPLFSVARFSGIAMQTATILLALGAAIVATVPEHEPFRTLRADTAAGLLARRSLPFIVVVPIVLGRLRVWGQDAGLIDTGLGTALLVLALIAVLCRLLWWCVQAVASRESALRKREAELQLIFDCTPFMLTRCGRDLRYHTVTRAYARMLGRQPQDLAGKPIAEIIGEEAFRTVLPHIEKVLLGQTDEFENELPLQGIGRRSLHVVYTPETNEDDQVTGWIGSILDITERKLAEQSLREHQERLAGLINSAIDAVIAVDAEQRIVLFNPAAEQMFGCAAQEVMGAAVDRFIPGRFRQAHRHHIEKFGEIGVTNRRMGALGSLSGVRANGEEFPIEAAISQMDVGGQKLFTVILRDITERKQAESELARAKSELERTNQELERRVQERTAALQEMVAELQHVSYAMVHDMRAPLRAMHAFAQFLLEDTPDAQPQTRLHCQRIIAAASRLDRLIQDALSYTKAVLLVAPRERVDLQALIQTLIDTYPNLQSDQADIRIVDPLPPVLGSESLLTQCFSNLLGNAVKFVPRGVRPEVIVSAEAQGESVRIWIQDNGIGIPEHARNRLFGMFERLTNEYEGTGIGLAIVRKVVERMGGKVGVEATSGKGSRFWVELKAASASDEQPEATGTAKNTRDGA